MFRWHKFWRVRSCVEDYLDYVLNGSSVPSHVHLLLFFLTLEMAILATIITRPFSDFQRLLLFDITLFWGCRQRVNLLTISVIFASMYMLYCSWYLVRRNGRLRCTLITLYGVLFTSNDQNIFLKEYRIQSGEHFFIKMLAKIAQLAEQMVHFRNGQADVQTAVSRQQTLSAYVQKLTQYYFKSIVNLAMSIIILVHLFNHVQLFRLLLLNWQHFAASLFGPFYLLQLLFTKFCLECHISGSFLIILSTSVLIFAFTCTSFIILKQTKQMIVARSGRRIDSQTFQTFAFYHTRAVVQILIFNPVISQMVLAFLIPQAPVNSYLVLEIILGRFDLVPGLILLCICSLQYIVIFGFHFLSALTTTRIHSVSPSLLRLYANRFIHRHVWLNSRSSNLNYQLKVSHYIERYHTHKPYGISYGKYGLISVNAFIKFVCLFGELILMSYQMIITG